MTFVQCLKFLNTFANNLYNTERLRLSEVLCIGHKLTREELRPDLRGMPIGQAA